MMIHVMLRPPTPQTKQQAHVTADFVTEIVAGMGRVKTVPKGASTEGLERRPPGACKS